MKSYSEYLKEPDVIDVITIDETPYAIVAQPRNVPGCTSVPVAQLPTHLKEFLSRGYSHRHRKSYASVSGVFAWTILTYSLENLRPVHKQTFSHALMGVTGTTTKASKESNKESKNGEKNRVSAGREGLLSKWRGDKLGRGAFIVPIDKENEASAFLDRWGVNYTREVVLRER